MFRSILAVAGGIVVLTVTSFGIEAAIAALTGDGSSGSAPHFIVMTTYTLLCIAGGGYVAAGIARKAPVGHAAAMGAVELLFTIGAMVQLGQTGRITAWLPGLLLIMPAAVGGGMIRARQSAHTGAARQVS